MNSDNMDKVNRVIDCKLCGKAMERHFRANGYLLYRCANCSFEQFILNDRLDRVIYESGYFENNKYKDVVSLARENKRRLSLLKKYVKEGGKVADYGCGSGEFVDYAGQKYEMYGFDISPDAIEIAKKRFSTYEKKFFISEDFKKGILKFDAICLWDVIEHIEDPNELIKLLKKRMNSDGIMILSTPDIGAMFAKISKTKWPFMTPPEHICFFSKKSIRYLAKKNGFEICEWFARGKWANVGFIIYKFNKVSRIKIPEFIAKLFCKGRLASLRLYVPTHDVQYVVLRKKGERRTDG